MSYEPALRGYVAGSGRGVPDRGSEVKASGQATGGSLTVMEITVDQGPPKHTHTREDESIYVFTGALQVECGDDRFDAGPGSFVFLPRMLPHTFRALGGPATGLLVVTPGGLDEYFADLHEALAANGGPAEIAAVQHKYGILRS